MHITHYYSVINFMQKGQQTRDHISLQKPFDDVSQLPVTLNTNLGNYSKGLNNDVAQAKVLQIVTVISTMMLNKTSLAQMKLMTMTANTSSTAADYLSKTNSSQHCTQHCRHMPLPVM